VAGDAKSPAHKRPEKPKVIGIRCEIDDEQEYVHSRVNCEMNAEASILKYTIHVSLPVTERAELRLST
jgi:hypothetical protein